ncbi:unnamed protein product [Cercospora beticola]|nr:unnamed protein product [Cercospora beticola]
MKFQSIVAAVIAALMAHTEIVAAQRGIPAGALRCTTDEDCTKQGCLGYCASRLYCRCIS